MQHRMENWDRYISRCNYLSKIQHKFKNHGKLTEDEIFQFSHFAFIFGTKGKSQLMADAINSDIESGVIEHFWSKVNESGFKQDNLCDQLCGKKSRCELVQLVKKNSPLFLPTEFSEKYIESEAASLFEKYLGNDIIYHIQTQSIYEYKDGVWVKILDKKLNMFLDTLLMSVYPDEQVNINKIHGLNNRLKCRSKISFEGDFNSDKFILNLKNGFFDLKTNQFLPHNKNYKTTVQFPVEYDPNASCDLFEEKLNEIFDGNQDVIDHFLKWMLYTLLPTYEHQKALLLLGKGGNGKSVLMDVWSELIGQDNVANQDLSNLATDRQYSVYQLVNKYVNFSKEISTLEKETNIFKALTGNDLISTRQIYGKPIDFRNKARLIISANQLPNFKIIDKAILRRFDIIKFNKRFDHKPDTLLNVKLKRELSGILNLVLTKSKDILHADGSIYFAAPEAVKKNLDLFSDTSSSTAEFVRDRCMVTSSVNAEYATTLKSIYDSYVEWCNNTQHGTPKSRSIFKDELETLFNCETHSISSVKTLSGRYHKNVHWVVGIKTQGSDSGSTALAGPIKKKLGLMPMPVTDSSMNYSQLI